MVFTTDTTITPTALPTGWSAANGNTLQLSSQDPLVADGCILRIEDLNLVAQTGGSNEYLFRTTNGGKIYLGRLDNETEFLADSDNVEPIVSHSCTYLDITGNTYDLIQNSSSEANPGKFFMCGGLATSKANGDIRSHNGEIYFINVALKNVEVYTSFKGLIYGCHNYETDYGFSDYQGKITKTLVSGVNNLIDNRYLTKDYNTVYRGLKATINTNMIMVDTKYQTTLGLIDIDFSKFTVSGAQSKTIYQFARSVNVKTDIDDVYINEIRNGAIVPQRNLYSSIIFPVMPKTGNAKFTEYHLLLYRRENGDASLAVTKSEFKLRLRKAGYIEYDIDFTGLTKENSTTKGFKYDIKMTVDKNYDTSIPLQYDTLGYYAVAQIGMSYANLVDIQITSTTITIKEDTNVNKLYNYIQEYLELRQHIENFATIEDDFLVINGVDVVLDGAKFTGNLKYNGNLTFANGGSIDGLYKLADGSVYVGANIQSGTEVSSKVFGIWLKSQGLGNRAGLLMTGEGGKVEAQPNTEYYFIADGVNATRSTPVVINTEDFGITKDVTLDTIKKVDGTNLLPDTLSASQTKIADMFNYDSTLRKVEIKLNSNFETDSRWNASSRTFTLTAEDCVAMQWKAEQIQSRKLGDPTTVSLREGEIVIEPTSTLTFMQLDGNTFNATINLSAFTIRRDGDNKMLNTFLDHSNGVITVNSGRPVVANISVPSSTFTTVVNSIPGKVNESTKVLKILDNQRKINDVTLKNAFNSVPVDDLDSI